MPHDITRHNTTQHHSGQVNKNDRREEHNHKRRQCFSVRGIGGGGQLDGWEGGPRVHRITEFTEKPRGPAMLPAQVGSGRDSSLCCPGLVASPPPISCSLTVANGTHSGILWWIVVYGAFSRGAGKQGVWTQWRTTLYTTSGGLKEIVDLGVGGSSPLFHPSRSSRGARPGGYCCFWTRSSPV
jgi:hypothetical protein